MSITVTHQPEQARFTAQVDGDEAGAIDYERRGDDVAFLHTVVDPAFEGRGIGSALAREALDVARREGWGVLPHCSFIQAYVERHPEYLGLVPVARRAEFSLPGA